MAHKGLKPGKRVGIGGGVAHGLGEAFEAGAHVGKCCGGCGDAVGHGASVEGREVLEIVCGGFEGVAFAEEPCCPLTQVVLTEGCESERTGGVPCCEGCECLTEAAGCGLVGCFVDFDPKIISCGD